MTAEIGILNKSAVALAADSAVTAQSTSYPKIYQSINKLFELSVHQPVGIMIYGSSEFMDIPLETLIKYYRETLSTNNFKHLYEYADDFLIFLESSRWMFPEDHQANIFKTLIYGCFSNLKEEIDAKVNQEIQEKNSINEQEVKTIVREEAKIYLEKIKEEPLGEGLSDDFPEKIQEKYKKEINDVIVEVFSKLPFTKTARRVLHQIAGRISSCEAQRSFSSSSGIVIAGFGKDDIYPGIVAFNLHGLWLNTLVRSQVSSNLIDNERLAIIMPFAQTEMVHTFIEGVDPYYQEIINSFISKLIHSIPDIVDSYLLEFSSNISYKESKKLSKHCNNILQKTLKALKDYRHSQHIRSVTSAVSILPKNELAEMAESLVNLTSFKRRMSMDLETVGGAIDVAVISKGDGFVWIKRKNYFDPHQNQRYVAKIFNQLKKGVKSDETTGNEEERPCV